VKDWQWKDDMNKTIGACDIIQQIKHILVEEMQVHIVVDQITDDYSLLEGGLALDSIVIAELIARIEDRFGIQFDDRVLNAELFNNLSLFANFVAEECLAAQLKAGGQSVEAAC
jgi:acyl carrier protein